MSKNNRVLLVYPGYSGEKGTPDRPPLGLLTIAAPLVKQGIAVRIIDERAEKDFDALLYNEMKQNPICVGISSMSGSHIAGALRISKMVKEQFKIPVVWGGVHPSLMPESTVRHELVDIIVRDDGEETFPKLLDCLADTTSNLHNIKGIGFTENGNVILTEPAEPARIKALPLIPFHLVDLEKYDAQQPWTSEKRLLPMETSRGCPFSCSFCTESVRKKKWRALPPERVISDIRQYMNTYGIRNFTFIDDNLFGDIRRGEKLIDLMVKEKLNIKWYTNIRTDYIAHASEKFLSHLELSGCRMLTFGAESGSERILKMINKRASKSDVIASNRNLKGKKIIPHFVMIRGFPSETRKELIETFLLSIQLLLENRCAISAFPFLIPTPGTVIAKQCLKKDPERYSLEDWIQIFDMEKNGRPAWVLMETFTFIKRYNRLVQLMARTNRNHIPKSVNYLLRLFLRFFKIILKLESL